MEVYVTYMDPYGTKTGNVNGEVVFWNCLDLGPLIWVPFFGPKLLDIFRPFGHWSSWPKEVVFVESCANRINKSRITDLRKIFQTKTRVMWVYDFGCNRLIDQTSKNHIPKTDISCKKLPVFWIFFVDGCRVDAKFFLGTDSINPSGRHGHHENCKFQ